MSKLWVIIKREYAQVVKKKTFLIGIILTPIFMAVIMIVPALLAQKKPDTVAKMAIIDLDGQGIGETFAEEITKYKLDDSSPAYQTTQILTPDPFDSLEIDRTRKELDSLILAKSLKSYLIIGKDIDSNDSCFMVAKSFSFRTSNRFDRTLSNILSGIRLKKSDINIDTDTVLTLTRRIEFKQQAPGGKERDFITVYLTGLIFVMIIFVTVITYGQVLMRSVIEEKNSRIIEVMVSSVSPFQLMAGKVIGLGLASLTQVGIWSILGAGVYFFKGNLAISPAISNTIFNPIFFGLLCLLSTSGLFDVFNYFRSYRVNREYRKRSAEFYLSDNYDSYAAYYTRYVCYSGTGFDAGQGSFDDSIFQSDHDDSQT